MGLVKTAIYLDNAATTFPKPESVHAAVETLSRTGAGNPGRGGHRFAMGSDAAIQDARRALASLLGASSPERVVLTLNATDALNMAIKGCLRPGDHAVTTDIEHNSVSRPLEGLARKGIITLTRVPCDGAGWIDAAAIRAAMTPRTRLVAVCHASNVLGILQDAEALAGVARAGGALLVLDASQSAGVIPIDVEAMGIDLLAFTGHKALLGPMGTGGLVVREGVPIGPWREGGTGGDSGSPTQPESFPHFLEGGTPNAVGLAGLGAGVRYVLDRGAAELGRHERAMARRLAQALAAVPRVRIHAAPGPEEGGAAQPPRARAQAGAGAGASRADDSPGGMARAASAIGLVTFTVEGYEPSEVAAILDQSFGIAMRAGMHCAPYIHRRLGLDPGGTVRASAGPFTTEREIDAAAAAVAEIAAA